MTAPYHIRPLNISETATMVAWAAAEGWKPGVGDMECYLACDPEGFLGGFIEDELVACISGVRYPGGFGFVGFYIVRPDYRGQGLGMGIWREAMARLEGCNAGLDGVLAQEANYAKSGFRRSHGNRRYEFTGRPLSEQGLVNAREVSFEALNAFDRRHFPGDRPVFLRAWLAQPGRTALAVVRDDVMLGYGVIRSADVGWRIGPLFAETADIAERLLAGLRGAAPENASIYMDVPTNNPAALELAERESTNIVFETARMYTGANPVIHDAGVFGVTSLELG